MVRDRADFHRVLEGVLQSNRYIESYIAELGRSRITGTMFENPLVGLVIQSPEDSEEFAPRNELVKRQIELLLFRTYGPLPYFVREGVAWTFELETLGELRTFTGRSEFIGVGDHAAPPGARLVSR
jgi:hypothetical protein